MSIVSAVLGRGSLTGAPIGLADDDKTGLIDDDGHALLDEGAEYNHMLHVLDTDGQYLHDDDGEPLADDPPYVRPRVDQWLEAHGASLRLQDGTEFRFRGVNWSSMESRMFPGLLSVRAYKSVTVDGKVEQGILDQIAELGFNAIRLPICIDMTWPGAVCQPYDGINTALNPDLISPSYTGPRDIWTAVNGADLLSPLEILDKMVAHAKALGMRVVLDMHCAAPNNDNAVGLAGRWYTSTGPNGPSGNRPGLPRDPRNEQQLLDAWLVLAERYKDEPAVCGFDLVNEPWACTWDDDPMTGIVRVYERLGNEIQKINPNVLIICEGNQITEYELPRYPSKYGSWPAWGQNLWNVHFRKVRLKLRQDKVCYAPHDYYESYFDWAQNYAFPDNQPEIWDTLWGWIVKRDIAPVILTEWGGNFTSSPARIKWANKLMDYLYRECGGKVSWFHWAMVPGNYTANPNNTVVGLIKQRDEIGGSNELWPLQEMMVRRFIVGSQDA